MWNQNLAQAYALSQSALEKNLEGLNHDDSLAGPPKGGNCINWVAGHILSTRRLLLAQLGADPFLSEEEAKPYGRGTPNLQPGDDCVQLDRLRQGLQETSTALLDGFKGLSQEQLDAPLDPSAFPFPVENPSLGYLATLLLFHEGYHAGQVGLGRRVLGKEGVIA